MTGSAGIQWKGTDACLDIHCECGKHTHFDGLFAYSIECGKCGQMYDLPTTITLLPFSGRSTPQITGTENKRGTK